MNIQLLDRLNECIGTPKPKLTQDEVARALDISQPKVGRWLKGESLPDAQELSKLADLFGVTTDELLGRGVRGMEMREAATGSDLDVWKSRANTAERELADLRAALRKLSARPISSKTRAALESDEEEEVLKIQARRKAAA